METILSLFKYLVDPVCLIDKEHGKIIMGNRSFELFSGYDGKRLAKSPPLDKIVYKRDFKNLQRRLAHMEKEQHLRGEIRLLTEDRVLKEAEVTIREIELGKQFFYMCSFRDISSQKDMERELHDKLAMEQGKVTETARGILRIKQLLDKLHFLPVFSGELAKCTSPPEVAQKAVYLMSYRNGFHYAHAAIFLIKGKYLELASSNKECALQKFHMEKQHRFAQVARHEKKMLSSDRGEFVIPIENIGILRIVLEESERLLVVKNEYIKKAHLDLLESLAQLLAIFLAHSRLLQENKLRCQKDLVTGLLNREYFLKQLEKKLQQKFPFSFLLIGLDQSTLMKIEESEIKLKAISKALSSCVPDDVVLARVGDDIFAIVSEHDNLKEASAWVDQVKRQMIRNFSEPKSNYANLTFSAGVTLYKGVKEKQVAVLWKQAFQCMEAAKKNRGNKIFYWQQRPQEFIRRIAKKLM